MNLIQPRPYINLLKRLLVLLLFAFFVFVIFGKKGSMRKTQAMDSPHQINKKLVKEENLRKHLLTIAGDEFEGRGAGYSGERKTAKYIAKQFKKYKLKPVADKIGKKQTYFQSFSFQPRQPEKPFQTLTSQNVIGFLEGSDKKLKKEIVVIGCHYDGQGRSGQAEAGRYQPDDKSLKDEIWNSADDNATSVAVLLEIARIISEQQIKPDRSILFIAFGAEEHALNGSAFYVENPVFNLKKHKAMLNLEKLGRIPDEMPITASSETSPIWEKIINKANRKTGLNVRSLIPELISDTDHYPFALKKIPAMVIGMAHEEDTHLPTDSVDKISFGKLTERTGFVLTAFLELTNSKEKMLFTGELKNELGFMTVVMSPDEKKQLGLNAESGGFKVSMLISKFPADKAGLKTGDILISMNGKRFTSKDKDERIFFKENLIDQSAIDLTILRDGKRKNLKLKLTN